MTKSYQSYLSSVFFSYKSSMSQLRLTGLIHTSKQFTTWSKLLEYKAQLRVDLFFQLEWLPSCDEWTNLLSRFLICAEFFKNWNIARRGRLNIFERADTSKHEHFVYFSSLQSYVNVSSLSSLTSFYMSKWSFQEKGSVFCRGYVSDKAGFQVKT